MGVGRGQDGPILGLRTHGEVLLVFKSNSVWRIRPTLTFTTADITRVSNNIGLVGGRCISAAGSAGAEALGGLGQVAEGDYVEGAGMLGGAATGTAAERLARHLHRRPSATALPVNPPVHPPARLRLPPVGVLPGALTPVGAGISPGQFQLNQALRPELWWLRP